MRLAIRAIAVVALVGLAAACYIRAMSKRPALIVIPMGQPRFHNSEAGAAGIRTTVLLPVALTNRTPAPLLCWVGVAIGNNPGPGPWYAGREVLRVGPRSGMVTLVDYDAGNIFFHSGFLVADYMKVQSPIETKARRLLHGLGFTKVATNDLWRSQVIGQIVQQ